MNGAASGQGDSPAPRPRRKKVVLADSRAPVTVLRTVVELEEQTSWAEEVVRSFIRTQFKDAVKFAVGTMLLFCALPLAFYLFPELSDVEVAGVSLPWLVLGVAPFPVLFAIGYWYNLVAERNERDFVDMVEK
ncbi:hypothetical protein [Actinokineospora globicatena]|uniref:hypothetical protein n=1 Tax=Actinokineospora globicatena TaxID=103729 RepID=UPI0020A4934A|nr:hypothetical protein [Actinokineospora globicatena]MCP2301186.1 hypothetical protein [Actinokineospora globicatena]GLW77178.1 hypothetical protein Aglo01_16600 [Actinokineospora globicatena]GLW84012.1 hypothetical protein Aglo02_16520 [Actinokineospora globicatena]